MLVFDSVSHKRCVYKCMGSTLQLLHVRRMAVLFQNCINFHVYFLVFMELIIRVAY